jgi:plastocyanin
MKWQHIFFLPLVLCFEAGNAVNGATGAINDTAPTVAEGEINVHSIEVSRREHLFTPNSINALPGDIVTFKFWPGSHSVIRASYGRPCEPYENVQGNEGQGFYSGIMSPDEVDVEQGSVRRYTTTGAGRH